MVPNPKLSVTIALLGFLRTTTNVSSRSMSTSPTMSTVMVFAVCPGRKVNVPLATPKSLVDAVPPAMLCQSTVTLLWNG